MSSTNAVSQKGDERARFRFRFAELRRPAKQDYLSHSRSFSVTGADRSCNQLKDVFRLMSVLRIILQ
jgi:hypothetical protein